MNGTMAIWQMQQVVTGQLRRYPDASAQDLVKALYQEILGCGHMAENTPRALGHLRREMESARDCGYDYLEPLGKNFARVRLGAAENLHIRPELIQKMFVLSSRETGSMEDFEDLLDALEDATLPIPREEVSSFLNRYRALGCPSIHHSDAFNAHYHPAYRVMTAELVRYLLLFATIDTALKRNGRVIMALDGMCCAGKTRIAELISQLFPTRVIHADDFFLRPEQRTERRYQMPGANIDYERLNEEVLLPASQGRGIVYRPFDCQTMLLKDPVTLPYKQLTLVEGTYSAMQAIWDKYNLHVWAHVPITTQEGRIEAREENADIFMQKWLPLERLYSDSLDEDDFEMDVEGYSPEDEFWEPDDYAHDLNIDML